MDCFSEISDAEKLYCDWGEQRPCTLNESKPAETLLVAQTHMNMHTCRKKREPLLYFSE